MSFPLIVALCCLGVLVLWFQITSPLQIDSKSKTKKAKKASKQKNALARSSTSKETELSNSSNKAKKGKKKKKRKPDSDKQAKQTGLSPERLFSIDQARQVQKKEILNKIIPLLKKASIPYIENVYIQNQKRHESYLIDCVALVKEEIWLFEFTYASERIEATRGQKHWGEEHHDLGGDPWSGMRPNPMTLLENKGEVVAKIAKSKRASSVPIKHLTLIYPTPAHIQGGRYNEEVMSLAQLRSKLKKIKSQKAPEDLKRLWKYFNQTKNEKSEEEAQAFHKKVHFS